VYSADQEEEGAAGKELHCSARIGSTPSGWLRETSEPVAQSAEATRTTIAPPSGTPPELDGATSTATPANPPKQPDERPAANANATDDSLQHDQPERNGGDEQRRDAGRNVLLAQGEQAVSAGEQERADQRGKYPAARVRAWPTPSRERIENQAGKAVAEPSHRERGKTWTATRMPRRSSPRPGRRRSGRAMVPSPAGAQSRRPRSGVAERSSRNGARSRPLPEVAERLLTIDFRHAYDCRRRLRPDLADRARARLPRICLPLRWLEARYEFLVCAGEPQPLRARLGLTISCDHGLDTVRKADIVLIPAWRDVDEQPPEPLLDALRAARHRGAELLSICTGTFVLAAAGLLAGRRATTHWMHADQLQRRYPAIDVIPEALYVDDGDILTSAGTASGIDLCLHLVRRDHGAEIANEIARRMIVPPIAPAANSNTSTPRSR